MERLAETPVNLLCPAVVETVTFAADAASVCIKEGEETRKLTTRLLVVADGARSSLRDSLGIASEQRDYDQHAVIANVQSQLPHNGRAFERFTANGPLAFLPTGGEARPDLSAIVWTQSPERASALKAMDEQAFLDELQEAFGYRLGRLQKVGERFDYPLSLLQSKEQVRSRVVVVGNAAHSLHPVAGQGYNLALRALMRLLENLAEAQRQGTDIGDSEVLRHYYEAQRGDQFETVQFSHLAATLFMSDTLPLAVGRDLGLVGLDVLPGLKSLFVRQAAGLK
jgi:ubiquinone biosynthesis UbiH/UbiF/VisC/COQ6 family hydroxylase